jgi:uncharacterized protein (TIGR00290 family)
MSKRILLSWSSGKDSAWALHLLRQNPEVEVVGLFTTLNAEFDRVAMHAVRSELLRRQAETVGLPLHTIPLPWPCPNERYETLMGEFIDGARRDGIEGMAFGDLFLEDIRAYREEKLRGTGIEPIFPVWGIPTDALAHEMVSGGLRAVVTCVDPRQLSPEFAGRTYDAAFLADLPPTADPCGERGEFHTFCSDGPMFRRPVAVTVGETVERDGFVFTDLLPAPE